MKVHAFASEPHYYRHIAPVWYGIPLRNDGLQRGEFAVRNTARIWAGQPMHSTNDLVQYEPGDYVLVSSYKDSKDVQQNYPEVRRILIEHGVGQSYSQCERLATSGSYSGGVDHEGTALFLCPNDQVAVRWSSQYPSIPAVAIGSPALDSLRISAMDYGRDRGCGCGGGNRHRVAVSFHWDGTGLCPELAWAFPRFASALGALARSYEVIGHGHPRVIDHLRPEYDLLGIKTAPSFEEVVTKADLFVADNTSALYEFAAMGRPVLCLEAEAWRKDAHHGLRFWDAIPGLSCSNPDDLVSMVTQALNDPLEAKELRRYALEVAYGPYLFGSATERAVEAIEKVVQGDLVGSG